MQRPRGDLADTLGPEDFVNTPSKDHRCMNCHRVPTNPQLSGCFNMIYCQPCSRMKTYCITYHGIINYADNKQLWSKIKDLRLRCPNWRGQCQIANIRRACLRFTGSICQSARYKYREVVELQVDQQVSGLADSH